MTSPPKCTDSLLPKECSAEKRKRPVWCCRLKLAVAGTVALAASMALLLLFCVYLPNVYIPQGHELIVIQKVKDTGVKLRPVDHEVVQSWGFDPVSSAGKAAGREDKEERKDAEDEDAASLLDEQNGVLSRFSARGAYNRALSKYKNRHILIGDIHGQSQDIRKLLRKIKYDKAHDNLIVLGDFTSKGRDSIGVLEELIAADAQCVIGNWDYDVLQHYTHLHGLKDPQFEDAKGDKTHIVGWKGKGRKAVSRLARKLQPNHINYIKSCAVMYTLGEVPVHSKRMDSSYTTGQGVAVHAGLQWDLTADLDDQDPLLCITMRSYLGPFYNETTDDPHEHNAVSWSKIWNKKHKNGDVDDKYVVYYGHASSRGLKLKQWSKGLDTGCVKGRHLTAMVIWKEKTAQKTLYRERVVQVSCAKP